MDARVEKWFPEPREPGKRGRLCGGTVVQKDVSAVLVQRPGCVLQKARRIVEASS